MVYNVNGCASASDSVYFENTSVNESNYNGLSILVLGNSLIIKGTEDDLDFRVEVFTILGERIVNQRSTERSTDGLRIDNLMVGVYHIRVWNKTQYINKTILIN